MGENRNAYRILVVMPEEKRPLGRLRRRWVDNIKMDLRYNAMEGSCEHDNELSGSIKCWKILSSYTIGGFSRKAQLHE
jgi:hypothetical protein